MLLLPYEHIEIDLWNPLPTQFFLPSRAIVNERFRKIRANIERMHWSVRKDSQTY
jgi:hypothetical protein